MYCPLSLRFLILNYCLENLFSRRTRRIKAVERENADLKRRNSELSEAAARLQRHEEAQRQRGKVEQYKQAGNNAYNAGKFAEARDHYTSALALNPPPVSVSHLCLSMSTSLNLSPKPSLSPPPSQSLPHALCLPTTVPLCPHLSPPPLSHSLTPFLSQSQSHADSLSLSLSQPNPLEPRWRTSR